MRCFVLLAFALIIGFFSIASAFTSPWTVEFHPHLRFYRLTRNQTVSHAPERKVRRVTEVHFGPFKLSAIDDGRRAQR